MEDSGILGLGFRVWGFYDSHALPMLVLKIENLKGWRVGAATSRSGNEAE